MTMFFVFVWFWTNWLSTYYWDTTSGKCEILKHTENSINVTNDLLYKDMNNQTISDTATEFYKNFYQRVTTWTLLTTTMIFEVVAKRLFSLIPLRIASIFAYYKIFADGKSNQMPKFV